MDPRRRGPVVACGDTHRLAARVSVRTAADRASLVLACADRLLRVGRYDEAIPALLEGSRLLPRQAKLQRELGLVYLRTKRAAEATTWLERSIAVAPDDPANSDTHLTLAIVFSNAGLFDDAEAHFDRSITLAPANAGVAYYGLVSSRRMTERDRPVLARIRGARDRPGIPEASAMMLDFAAGKMLDDLAEYEGAMQHFDLANRRRRELSQPFDPSLQRSETDRILEHLSPESLADVGPHGDPSEVPTLVLGMPRSGTTLVDRILSSHPAVRGAGELPFWNPRGPAWLAAGRVDRAARAARDRVDYLCVLEACGAERVTDKMPFNFRWIGLVHALFPGARIVHCRRDPVATCFSIYSTPFSRNWPFASEHTSLAAYYKEYARLLAHWRGSLPDKTLIDVDYEDVVDDLEGVGRRLIDRVGLPWDARCAHPEKNPETIATASKWQARQPVYRSSIDRWRHYERWLGDLTRALGD
jgi:tetratricopeptide (TPR) repeat protein